MLYSPSYYNHFIVVISISLKLFQLLVDWSLCGKLTFLCQRDIIYNISKRYIIAPFVNTPENPW